MDSSSVIIIRIVKIADLDVDDADFQLIFRHVFAEKTSQHEVF